jgi:hypothetical protein
VLAHPLAVGRAPHGTCGVPVVTDGDSSEGASPQGPCPRTDATPDDRRLVDAERASVHPFLRRPCPPRSQDTPEFQMERLACPALSCRSAHVLRRPMPSPFPCAPRPGCCTARASLASANSIDFFGTRSWAEKAEALFNSTRARIAANPVKGAALCCEPRARPCVGEVGDSTRRTTCNMRHTTDGERSAGAAVHSPQLRISTMPTSKSTRSGLARTSVSSQP